MGQNKKYKLIRFFRRLYVFISLFALLILIDISYIDHGLNELIVLIAVVLYYTLLIVFFSNVSNLYPSYKIDNLAGAIGIIPITSISTIYCFIAAADIFTIDILKSGRLGINISFLTIISLILILTIGICFLIILISILLKYYINYRNTLFAFIITMVFALSLVFMAMDELGLHLICATWNSFNLVVACCFASTILVLWTMISKQNNQSRII
jgi:hypothetical protein